MLKKKTRRTKCFYYPLQIKITKINTNKDSSEKNKAEVRQGSRSLFQKSNANIATFIDDIIQPAVGINIKKR